MREEEASRLDDARAGDQQAFERLTAPYRRELLVHCYRILGSVEDAEDLVQETLLRAWRRLDAFTARASMRAWLYKIATHAALDALDRRPRRAMPTSTHPQAALNAPLSAPVLEPLWLEPLPDTLLDERPAVNPHARYEVRESVTLAFLTVLQTLPGRQRAILIFRDVLGWSAREAAETLDMTVVAVNSVLQRARTTLKKRREAFPSPAAATEEQTASLLARYVAAWEAADTTALIALLREDALITMPPIPQWYRGRADLQWFYETYLFTERGRGRYRLLATRANGGPAFVAYFCDEEGVYRPAAIQLLTLVHGQIAEIHAFLPIENNRFFSRFGLPLAF